MGITKYVEIGKINFYNSFVYVVDMIANAIFIGLIIFIFINLWQVIYSENPLIEGFTITMMIWYLVMTESITISPGRIIEEIGEEMQSGNIANSLNKPYNYILYKYASTLGKTVFRFFLTFLIGAIITIIFVGGIKVNLLTIPLILLTVFIALSINFLMTAFLGISALWLEDARALHFVYQKFIFTIGGMLLPLEIFPDWLRSISEKLPFSFVAYYPAKLFVKFDLTLFFEVVIKQIFWVIVLAAMTYALYRICIRRVSINGG